MLKSQDLLVAVHRVLHPKRSAYAQIASDLHIGVGTAHRAFLGAKAAGLVASSGVAIDANIIEFLVHGARYVFPPVYVGGNTRGVPTAGGAPGLSEQLLESAPIVWPDTSGRVRGQGLEPIHASAVAIASKDLQFYQVLAAIDLLRIGGARQRQVGADFLRRLLTSRG